jgi:hypothetical protein
VDIPQYDDAAPIHKTTHCYFAPQALVTANATLQNQITVDLPALFFEGAIIRVHSPTYSNHSVETTVASIAGSVLTLADDLGYLPSIDDEVELIGFVSDESLPYRIL